MEAWVEQGKAPTTLIATKYEADMPSKPVKMTRPLCLYPKVAKWSGKGDSADHKTFTCVMPSKG
jgi:feruloyl esterase